MALATSVWPTARLPTLRLREVEPFATAEALWDALEALRHPSLLHMALTLVQMERAAEAHAGRLVLLDPHLSFSVRNPSQWCNIAAACVGIWGAARVTRPISNCLLPARFDFGGMFRMTGVALAKPAAEGDVVRLVLWANGLAIHKQASILKGGQTELALTRPLLLPSVPYNYDGTSSYDTMHIWLETWPPHSVAQSTGVEWVWCKPPGDSPLRGEKGRDGRETRSAETWCPRTRGMTPLMPIVFAGAGLLVCVCDGDGDSDLLMPLYPTVPLPPRVCLFPRGDTCTDKGKDKKEAVPICDVPCFARPYELQRTDAAAAVYRTMLARYRGGFPLFLRPQLSQSFSHSEPMTLADRIADRGPCAALFASDGAEPSSDTVMPVELSRSVTLTW